jgi:hypothetical protein
VNDDTQESDYPNAAAPYLLRALQGCVNVMWLRALANEISAEEAVFLRAGNLALRAAQRGTDGLKELLEKIP